MDDEYAQMMIVAYVLLDVFSETPLSGNPLAVVGDARMLSDEQMQSIARELSLSETVFVLPPRDGNADARVRIFTPQTELPFAGHPVLGAAVAVARNEATHDQVALETGAGIVRVHVEQRGERIAFARMQQPIPTWRTYERPSELFRALRVDDSHPRLPIEVYCNGPEHVYVEFAEPGSGSGALAALAALDPDLRALGALGEMTVSCFAGERSRWRTRVFAPGLGVGEDPATGSAAGPLAVHLARHGRIGFGEEIEIRQGEELGRPSTLYALARGSGGGVTEVEVAGAAVLVGRGELTLA